MKLLRHLVRFYQYFWGYLALSLGMSAFTFWSNTPAGCLCAGFCVGLVVAHMIFVYPRDDKS